MTERTGTVCQETPLLKLEDALEQIMRRVFEEIMPFVKANEPEVPAEDLPELSRTRDLQKADFTVQWSKFCAKRKLIAQKYVEDLVLMIQKEIERDDAGGNDSKFSLIQRVEAVGPYMNIFVKRAKVFKLAINAIIEQGEKYGETNAGKGKKVIIEHTSSNPNAPLHIGNLRNVMIGAHLARVMKACGCEVTEAFYVNDLGAQIGLTALAYSRIYTKIKPTMKIDQWIGAMYAVMNTCQELQQVGVQPGDLEDACKLGEEAVKQLFEQSLTKANNDEKKIKGINEYFDIYQDLRGRFQDMMDVMIADVRQITDIKTEAGKLNLAYEKQEPWAIKIFRKMVIDCLTGVQETLSTYGVQHDRFDFESELGWEGSNDKVLEIMKNSDYFVPQTQSNDKGIPQGAYLDMDAFIRDQKFKIGKGGYQKDYPPLYVLRPDGSTLYTYRDIVYSFKKASMSDLILNIICSEQDLAQQKVALGMCMMNPAMKGRQYHLSYDLVKLTTGKMSGRRGRYLLADDLYLDLKDIIKEKMAKKSLDKGETIDEKAFEVVTHEISAAAMKYALLSCSCQTQINFDIAKITDFEDASAPFILYNSTRLRSVIAKYETRVSSGELPPLADIKELEFDELVDDKEWALLMEYVLPFSQMLCEAALPKLPEPPALPSYGTHRVCEFLNGMVRAVSGYYGPAGVRILPMTAHVKEGEHAWNKNAMFQRVWFLTSLRQVVDNGLRLLMIEPLEKM